MNYIDMREELSNGNNSVFSQKLIEEIELNLKNIRNNYDYEKTLKKLEDDKKEIRIYYINTLMY